MGKGVCPGSWLAGILPLVPALEANAVGAYEAGQSIARRRRRWLPVTALTTTSQRKIRIVMLAHMMSGLYVSLPASNADLILDRQSSPRAQAR